VTIVLALPSRRSWPRLARLVRYGAVSAVATVTSLTVLTALVATRTTAPAIANVIATGVGTVPSFELNRRWVWGRRGRRSVRGEIAPFVALSFTGLALSTAAVALAAAWADGAGLGAAARTVAVNLANLAAFGALWVLQYVLLDRVLFGPATRRGDRRPSGRRSPSARRPDQLAPSERRRRTTTAPANSAMTAPAPIGRSTP
jgi:putative flippase GtrA